MDQHRAKRGEVNRPDLDSLRLQRWLPGLGPGGETRCAAQILGGALGLGALRLLLLSQGFSTPQGAGGMTLLLGCALITCVLWVMLALKSLAAGSPAPQELTDGLTAMAVTASVIALEPPRASNFTLEAAVDDFAWAYLPVSLLAVFVTLACQALWKRRQARLVWVRLATGVCVCSTALAALLFFVSGGADAGPSAARALLCGTLAGGGAGLLHLWSLRAR